MIGAARALLHPGPVVLAGLLALGAVAFGALVAAAGAAAPDLTLGPYLRRVIAFSVAQAGLSTILSLALGAALALALARRHFPGRSLVLALVGAAVVMPSIVVVFAIVAVYGRAGHLADLLALLGLPPPRRIFGWPGILLAHVFLNAALATRVFLEALARAPAEHWRLAGILGFGPAATFRHLDWPILKNEIPGLAGLVFLLCFTSFAIVLTLGGGPGRATLEVAIFQALRLELDFGRAAFLAAIQLAICLALALVLHRTVRRAPVGATTRLPERRPDAADRRLLALDCLVMGIAALLFLPILASTLAAATHLPRVLDADLARAAATSLAIALASASLACAMALALGAGARRARARGGTALAFDLAPTLVLAIPPFALTAGLFLLLRGRVAPFEAGLILLPLVNALGALPFAYRLVAPALATTGERYGRLAAMLGMSGQARLRIVDWPSLKRPLAGAFAMAAALSLGDFGIVALFGGGQLRTLPFLVYERLGAYRLDEAGAIGLLLVAGAAALAWLSLRLSR